MADKKNEVVSISLIRSFLFIFLLGRRLHVERGGDAGNIWVGNINLFIGV